MRKLQQKQILDIIDTLHKANDEIERLFLCKDLNAVLELLTDCQGGVVQIGQFIEMLEGEGTRTVTLLEEYHDSLYNSGENLETIDIKFAKRLQNQLLQIENMIKSELKPDRIEVAFFPYKASMWDSLESIWLAASQDPNCDAYVVPIPYFDLLPNGKVGQVNYEGNLYPDDIPIVDWQSYNLEERRPDVIFIHNPYDEGNYITSIHPDYYSRRLKEFTEMLCYVPYFVSFTEVEEHFVLCPGVLNADRVFLQSEKVRDTYIQLFQKFEKENSCFGRFGDAQTKFVSLGSPKYDCVLNATKDEFDLPKEWEKNIDNKKVVFYNTSVGPFLQDSEQYLKKLQSVLETFRTHNTLALWWRPHPLMEATCQSMRPELLDMYRKIVSDYKHGGWGIYDDTSDLHRVIAKADAMYGDYASVGALFSATGKPVLISNVNVECDVDADLQQEYLHSDVIRFGQRVFTTDGPEQIYPNGYEEWMPYQKNGQTRYVLLPDYEYGISNSINAIYEINEECGRVNYLNSFPEENNDPWLYNSPIRMGNTMLFSPKRARKWAFYDFITDEWTYEELPKDLYPSKELYGVFGNGIISGNELLFFPVESGLIAKYNIDTRKITYHLEWFSKLRDHVVDFSWGMICSSLYYEDSLLLVSQQTNIVIQLNPRTMEVVNTFKVGEDNCGFKTAFLIPNTDMVYMIKFREPGKTPWNETIIKWNLKSASVEEFKNLPISFTEKHTLNALHGFISWKDAIYAIPLHSDSILKINLKTDEITRLELAPEMDFFERKTDYYDWAIDQALPYQIFNVKRMKYMAQLPYNYSLVDINLESGEISNKRKWYAEGIANIYKTKGKGGNLQPTLVESHFLTLTNFIELLDPEFSSRTEKEERQLCWYQPDQLANEDGTAGRSIYDYVKLNRIELITFNNKLSQK